MTKSILVTGAAGFIGMNLCRKLTSEGHLVYALDIKPRFQYNVNPDEYCHEYIHCDLRTNIDTLRRAMDCVDYVYHLAADMGGMGFIKGNDIACLTNNNLIDINVLTAAADFNVRRLLYSSSACVYPNFLQDDVSSAHKLVEEDAFPADPQDGYGWQKLTTEKLITAYRTEQQLDFRAVRFHNCYGPYGAWTGGREKAPAAMCRKIAEIAAGVSQTSVVEMWGTGQQLRSYMYIDDCVNGLIDIMNHVDYPGVCNLGVSGAVTVDHLLATVADVADVNYTVANIPGPVGVASRDSNNEKFHNFYGWEPKIPLKVGITATYEWIFTQVMLAREAALEVHETRHEAD